MTTSKIEYSSIPTLNLDYGEKKSIKIKVIAENGNELIYTLNVTRKDDRDGNNNLKNITITIQIYTNTTFS